MVLAVGERADAHTGDAERFPFVAAAALGAKDAAGPAAYALPTARQITRRRAHRATGDCPRVALAVSKRPVFATLDGWGFQARPACCRTRDLAKPVGEAGGATRAPIRVGARCGGEGDPGGLGRGGDHDHYSAASAGADTGRCAVGA